MLFRTGIFAGFLVGAMCIPASAAERIFTPRVNCASIQNKLINGGAAILRYPSKRNPSLTLYDRYVGDSRYCGVDEIGKWATVPANDTQSCRVIACERYEPSDLFPFKRRNGLFLRLRISN